MKKATKILVFALALVLLLSFPVYADEPKQYEATENYETVTSAGGNTDLIPYGTWMAGSNEVYSLVNILSEGSIKMTSGFSGGDYRYYVNSTTNNQYGVAINGPYKHSDEKFKVGNSHTMDKGFGTHPKANQTPVHITIDISAYTDPDGLFKFDTFYSCVGLTNTASSGVYFQVFGDYGDGKYKQLANSEAITSTTLGEFNVNIAGVKTLQLVVITSTMNNSSSACAWLYPSIFKADPSATKPSNPKLPEPDNSDGSKKYNATQNFAEVVWSDTNRETRPFGAWMAGLNPVISLVDTIPGEKLAHTTGQSPNYEYYTDSTTLNEYGVSINGPFKKSGVGYTVGTNVPFKVGFGTHPRPKQEQSYINLDVSKYTDPNGEYQCDTFYSCVALTNTASNGVYFQVFADYGDGHFKHIANSTAIVKSNIGEFNVDITGVKTLRLVVISATMVHGSSASAWLNPSIFKADPNATMPDFSNYDPTVEYEKEPVVDAPLFSRPAEVEKPSEVPVGLIIGIVAGVIVVAGAVCAVIIIDRKKKQK